MATTVEEFVDQFPEFSELEPQEVQTHLDDADALIDRAVWGEERGDIGQKYLAAHMIALSPFGQQARLVAKGAMTTTYKARYDAVMQIVAGGPRII